MNRDDPEAPSIDTPLAHEAEIEAEHELELGEPQLQESNELEPERGLGWEL
jgi:hypothetical protein